MCDITNIKEPTMINLKNIFIAAFMLTTIVAVTAVFAFTSNSAVVAGYENQVSSINDYTTMYRAIKMNKPADLLSALESSGITRKIETPAGGQWSQVSTGSGYILYEETDKISFSVCEDIHAELSGGEADIVGVELNEANIRYLANSQKKSGCASTDTDKYLVYMTINW